MINFSSIVFLSFCLFPLFSAIFRNPDRPTIGCHRSRAAPHLLKVQPLSIFVASLKSLTSRRSPRRSLQLLIVASVENEWQLVAAVAQVAFAVSARTKFFRQRHVNCRAQQSFFTKAASVPANAQLASCAMDMVSTMLDDSAANTFK